MGVAVTEDRRDRRNVPSGVAGDSAPDSSGAGALCDVSCHDRVVRALAEYGGGVGPAGLAGAVLVQVDPAAAGYACGHVGRWDETGRVASSGTKDDGDSVSKF